MADKGILAPDKSFELINSLNLATTIQNLSFLSAVNFPSNTFTMVISPKINKFILQGKF